MLSASALSSTLYFSSRPIIDVTPMMGGLSHRLYLVTYHANGTATQCVVRCINDELLATQEYALMGHASVLSASTKALERMSIDGQLVSLIIMEFIQGDLAKDVCLNDEHLTIIAEQLTSLHQSLPSSPVKRPSVNKLSLIDDYWQLVANASAQDISRYQHCYELLRHLSFENTSLIHGDLNLSNLIVNTHNNGVVWLDWEYASVGDAYFDYAAFIVECDQEIEGPFIEYIQSQLDDVVDRDKLVYFKLYYVLVSWLWCMGLAESKTPQLIAALNKYRDEVDQLVAVIAASDISL